MMSYSKRLTELETVVHLQDDVLGNGYLSFFFNFRDLEEQANLVIYVQAKRTFLQLI